MDARDVAAGSPRISERAQVARGPRSRLVRRAALAVVGLATLAFAAPAAAATETFDFTGAAQTWTVPAGVTSATFDLYGAEGGGPRASSRGTRRPSDGDDRGHPRCLDPGQRRRSRSGAVNPRYGRLQRRRRGAVDRRRWRRGLGHPHRRHGARRPRARRRRGRRSGFLPWGQRTYCGRQRRRSTRRGRVYTEPLHLYLWNTGRWGRNADRRG